MSIATPGRARIALVSHSLGWGGLERVILDLARGLGQAGYQPVCVSLTDDQAMGGAFDAAGIERHVVTGPARRLPFLLARWLRRQAIDVVHAHNFGRYFHAGPAAWLAGRPSFYTEHSNLLPDERLLWRAQPWVSRLAPVVVADAAGVRDVLIRDHGLRPERVQVIHNGIDLGPYGQLDRTAARAALGLPAEALLLGTVARLVPVKNQALMLRALTRVPQAHLVVAGDGPLRGDLEAHARQLGLTGRLTFLGRRDDVPLVLAALDAFVLTSLSEGLPIAVIEAMAAGLPVVATDVGGLPELVQPERTGLLVPSDDEAALAAALARLADADLRCDWGAAGRAEAEGRFSLSAMVEAYQAVYERLLAGGRNRPRGRQ